MAGGRRGVTLVELLMVLAIFGSLLAMAGPSLSEWRQEAVFRESASELYVLLTNVGSRAVRSHYEHRIELDLESDCYRVLRGNRAEHSTDASWEKHVVYDWTPLNPQTDLTANKDCGRETGVVKIGMNPDGSGSSQYLCIQDRRGHRKYRVGIPFSTLPRVVVQKWDPDLGQWK